VYTYDNAAFGSPIEKIIFESTAPITDAAISIGQKFGKEVVIFIYDIDKSVFLATLVDGQLIGPPDEVDLSVDDIDPDAILDSVTCDLRAIWSTMDGNNYDLARRNGVLVED
jgi:hypothetical protein